MTIFKFSLIDNHFDVAPKVCNEWTLLQNLCRHYTCDNLVDVENNFD